MKNPKTLEDLEQLKLQILVEYLPPTIFKQLEALQTTIDLVKGSTKNFDSNIILQNGDASVHENVIINMVDLVEKTGHPATNKQIIEYLKQKGVYLGKQGDKDSAVGAILYAEKERDNSRIRKVRRGFWDKKREKLNLNLNLSPKSLEES